VIEVNATLFTLLVEGFALACVFLLTSFVHGAWRGSRDRKALRALVANINGEAGARLERTRELLDNGDNATALANQERSVCEAFIRAYHKRAAGSVSNIYTTLKTLVDAYQQQLEGVRQVPEPTIDEMATNAKDAVIVKLKNDYEQTIQELQITKNTMNKMLREYNSMFAGGVGDEPDAEANLEAAEILQMLESGGLGDDDEAAEPAHATVAEQDAGAESGTR
jgi:hypothetical protein